MLDPQVHLVLAELVDPGSLAPGALLGILDIKEKQDLEGFLVSLACLDPMDHLVLRVTEEYQETLDLLEWEWRDLLDPLDLMGHLDLLALESQEPRDLGDLQENTVAVACLVVPGQLGHLVTANFVKHLRCKQTEGPQRKDNRKSIELCNAYLKMDHVCRKLLTTAEVVTNVNCQLLDWVLAVDTNHTMLLVIFVTHVLLIFISFHLCAVNHSSCCKLVSFTIVTKKYLCFNTGEK